MYDTEELSIQGLSCRRLTLRDRVHRIGFIYDIGVRILNLSAGVKEQVAIYSLLLSTSFV
jgi:hypothetical protein